MMKRCQCGSIVRLLLFSTSQRENLAEFVSKVV